MRSHKVHCRSLKASKLFAAFLYTLHWPHTRQTNTHNRVVFENEGIVRCVLKEQLFQGEGRKKADAKRDAAANALAWLQEQPLWEQQTQLPPLHEVLAACFTNQVWSVAVSCGDRVDVVC